MLHVSRTMHHMIVIYDTHDNVPRLLFHFFKILIFWVVRGVKTQKTVQNEKNFEVYYQRFHVNRLLVFIGAGVLIGALKLHNTYT